MTSHEPKAEPPARKPRPDIQEKLVAAALDLLLEITPADLLTAVGTRAIAERAGVSKPTVFHQFGSVEGLADAVIAQVYNPGVLPLDAMVQGMEAIKAAGLPVEAGQMFHRAEFRRLTSDRGLRLRMGLWALGAGAADPAYKEFLRVTDGRLADFLERLWEHWGREVRSPFDTATFVAAQVALTNGLSVRHLVDPEMSTEENFGLVATLITISALRVRGDRHDMADRLAEMNYYPLRNARTGVAITERMEKTRAGLMAAASELFGAQGYEETTVAQIARKAGANVSTLYRLFGNKAGLAIALFRKQAADTLVFQVPSSGTPGERLHAHLVTVAHFAAVHTDHAPAYLTGLMCSKPDPDDDALLARTVELITVAQESGEIPRGASPLDLAPMLLGSLIGRVLSRPADPALEHVRVVSAALGG